ncbi:MAG: hypothetical protein AAGP08_19395, partial [Pseudomonadota bacterium]
MLNRVRLLIAGLCLVVLAACGAEPVQTRAQLGTSELIAAPDPAAFEAIASDPDVLALARTLLSLSPAID